MKLMILDGNSILNRGFYGVRPLTAPDGTPTNAVFGFLNIFNRLYSDVAPDAVCVAFDMHAPTFRHRACDTYKATRRPTPEDLLVQMPLIRDVLKEMGIRTYEIEGYEADDILGTAARICNEAGHECVVVTGDKDSLQLVTDKTTVCIIRTAKGDTTTTFYTPELFRAEYGFEPEGMVDLKALMGDSSDNISGVPGIGEKGAMDLMHLAGSIDAIYSSLDSLDIRDSVRKKLRDGESDARKSYWLASIFREVPIGFVPEENIWHEDFRPGLYALLKRLGFNRLILKYRLSPSSDTAKNETADEPERGRGVPEMTRVRVSSGNLEEVISGIRECGYVSVIALQGLDSIEFCDGGHIYSADRLSMLFDYDRLLGEVFSGDVRKVSVNIKQLMTQLLEEGLPTDGFVFDCALAEYLISGGDGDYSTSSLSVKYLGGEYEDVKAIFCLYEVMNEKLGSFGMDSLYYSAELPLCVCLAEMEHKGFLVDRNALYAFGESLTVQIDALQDSIVSRAGHSFNINSPKQLGEVLFEELGLPNGKKTKTGWSTSAEVLESIAPFNPIVDEILEYRMLTKLKSTYADGLLKVISDDGRIHTSFQMTVTATGRLSSTEPNLQNIPVRKQLGGQIRGMFIAPEGSVLVDADYSQIELRLLAHISDDGNMISAFRSGLDFHTVTASNVFRVPIDQVTPEIRSRAKAVNFGIVYGMAAFTLARDINVSVREAKEYMDAYFAEYSSVDRYLRDVVGKASENGYVSTLFGRRRYIPELRNSNRNIREFGKRVAMNMPIQGTAADIMKLAMVSARENLRKAGLKAGLVLQVHDELIVECPESEAEEVGRILKESMEQVAKLNVPIPVEVGTGKSWAEAH